MTKRETTSQEKDGERRLSELMELFFQQLRDLMALPYDEYVKRMDDHRRQELLAAYRRCRKDD